MEAAPQRIDFVFSRSPEGGYEAHAIRYSIFTQADSLSELEHMVRDAVLCHFDTGGEQTEIHLKELSSGDETQRDADPR